MLRILDLRIKMFVGFSWEGQTASKPENADVWHNFTSLFIIDVHLFYFKGLWGLVCSWHCMLVFLEGHHS